MTLRTPDVTDVQQALSRLTSPVRVSMYWPMLREALATEGIDLPLTGAALAATVAVETGYNFGPVREHYNGVREDYFERLYGYKTRVGKKLGNTQPGDGGRFYGRGQIQLTGRANYHAAGVHLGLDLVGDPDLVLQGPVSARIAAWFFRTHRVSEAAELQDWELARRRVNGGLNGYTPFRSIVLELVALLEVPEPVVLAPPEPPPEEPVAEPEPPPGVSRSVVLGAIFTAILAAASSWWGIHCF